MEDRDRTKELLEAIQALETTKIHIGILGDGDKYKDTGMTVLGVATVHEFGYVGPDKNGNFMNIPERSFIRSSFDKHKDTIATTFEKQIDQVINLEIKPDVLFQAIGEYCVGLVKEFIANMTEPELQQATIDAKGHSKLLVQEGQLINSIEYEVVK